MLCSARRVTLEAEGCPAQDLLLLRLLLLLQLHAVTTTEQDLLLLRPPPMYAGLLGKLAASPKVLVALVDACARSHSQPPKPRADETEG